MNRSSSRQLGASQVQLRRMFRHPLRALALLVRVFPLWECEPVDERSVRQISNFTARSDELICHIEKGHLPSVPVEVTYLLAYSARDVKP